MKVLYTDITYDGVRPWVSLDIKDHDPVFIAINRCDRAVWTGDFPKGSIGPVINREVMESWCRRKLESMTEEEFEKSISISNIFFELGWHEPSKAWAFLTHKDVRYKAYKGAGGIGDILCGACSKTTNIFDSAHLYYNGEDNERK